MRTRARLLVIDKDPSMDAEFRRLLKPLWPEEPSWHLPEEAPAVASTPRAPDAGSGRGSSAFPMLDLEFASSEAEGVEVVRLSLAQEQRIAVAFVGLASECWEDISVVERLWQLQPDLPIVLCVDCENLDWTGIIPHLGQSDRLLILRKPIDNLELRQLAYSLIARTQAEHALLQTRDQLMHCSRLAGMAQIATAVLHNVGNVLTSVNISTSVIAQRLARSESASLLQLATLLPTDPDELSRFLTEDSRGRLVRSYLNELAQAIDGEHRSISGELRCVIQGIEHIKQVVARQQDHARVKAMIEPVELASLLDDALRSKLESLAAAGVELTRDYPDVPRVAVDRHKTLHILINLINNAAEALQVADCADKRLTVALDGRQDGFVRVTVADNGVGIAAADRDRVFRFGFTTKPGGHGFGLHGAANDAQEMGGSLRADSAGPGEGATFTLELPVWVPARDATLEGRPAVAP